MSDPSSGTGESVVIAANMADPGVLDDPTRELLRLLLTLPLPAAHRIRDETPRRRTRRPQQGPGLDLGFDG